MHQSRPTTLNEIAIGVVDIGAVKKGFGRLVAPEAMLGDFGTRTPSDHEIATVKCHPYRPHENHLSVWR